MSKKKHQTDPNEGDSTDSGDDNDNSIKCKHVNRSVDLSKVKRSIIKNGLSTDCEQCKNMPPSPSADAEFDIGLEFDESLWLCLRCGNKGCGRAKNKHALQHFNTPHSDSHALCVNLTSWSVWCYDCDEEVNPCCKKKLLEAVEYLQKQAESKNNTITTPNKPVSI